MKKLSILILGTLASASVLAAPAPKTFTGASVGSEIGTTKYKAGGVSGKNSSDFNLTAGYGFEYGDTGFVGSVEGKVKPIKSRVFKGANGDIKEKARYGVSYSQGYRVTNDLLPYARIGFTESRLESSSKSKHKARGYDVGLGAKYAVAPNVEVGVEYVHSELRSTKKNADGSRSKLKGNGFNTGVSYRF